MDISVLTSILTGGDGVMRIVPDTGAVSNSTIGKTSHSQTNKASNDADNCFVDTLEEKMSNKETTESESTQIPVEKKPNDRAINTQQEPQAQASPTAPQTSQGLSQQTENTAMENPQGIENTELNAQSEGANALAEQETAQIVTPLAAQAETAENTQLIATEFIPAATSLQPSDAQAAVVPDTPAVAVDQPTPSDNTQQLPTENTSQTILTPADQPATGTKSAPETESAPAILQNDPKVLTAQQAKTPQNSTLKANTTPETGTTTPTESIKPQMQQLNPAVQPVPDDTPVPKTVIPAEKTETTGLVTIATEDNTQPAEPAIARPLDAVVMSIQKRAS